MAENALTHMCVLCTETDLHSGAAHTVCTAQHAQLAGPMGQVPECVCVHMKAQAVRMPGVQVEKLRVVILV